MSTSDPIGYYCLNLAGEDERRNLAQLEADREGISLQFVAAVDGRNKETSSFKDYDDQKAQQYAGTLFGSELGCIESHKKALKMFLASAHDYGVILEDDFILSKGIAQTVENLVQKTNGWDIVRLETRRKNSLDLPIVEIDEVSSLVVSWRLAYGATGLLYTKEGARTLLEKLAVYYLPFDSYFFEILDHQLDIVAIYPPVVTQGTLTSNIDQGGRLRTQRVKERRAKRRFSLSHFFDKKRKKKVRKQWAKACAKRVRAKTLERFAALDVGAAPKK